LPIPRERRAATSPIGGPRNDHGTASSEPATQVTHADIPASDLDPYCDTTLIEPCGTYRVLQDLRPAVWIARYQMFALAAMTA
jgi:hypothetical protein